MLFRSIDAAIEVLLVTQPSQVWLERLREARIPCAPVNDLAQALADPQVLARDMVVEVPLASGESLRMPGNPVKLSGDTPVPFTPPPALGQHTEQVLCELLGYDALRIALLRASQVIQ